MTERKLSAYINTQNIKLARINWGSCDIEDSHYQSNISIKLSLGFPVLSLVKNLPVKQETWLNPWVGKILRKRKWQPIIVFLPGKFHGQRRLVGYSPWGHKESDNTEQLTLPLLKVLRLRIIKKTFQYEKNVGCLFLAKKVLGIKVHFVKGE